MAAKSKPNEIYLERIYDAPVKAVWDAYTDEKQAAKWWGPRGFTITTHKKELKPGGHWDYTMHGPDGKDWPNVTLYHEVEKHKKLVYDHGGNASQPPLFKVTVLFSDIKGKTKMEMWMAFSDEAKAIESRKFIKQAGGNSTWDRLAEYLEKEDSQKEIFVTNRSFNAPIDVLFKMWTEPKHVQKWMPPTGATMEYITADIRPGGKSFYVMTIEGGTKMYGRAEYLKIEKPNLLVYTQQFTDKDNKETTRHPFAPTWPATMLTTVQLTAESPTDTRVTITWEIVGDATREEMETFIASRGGMSQGWGGSFDKLENYLSSLN